MNKSIISADNKKTVLDNGLRIVTNTIQHTNGVSINYLFGAGSRYESVNLSGASHLFEHVLFKGTKKRPTPVPKRNKRTSNFLFCIIIKAFDKDIHRETYHHKNSMIFLIQL